MTATLLVAAAISALLIAMAPIAVLSQKDYHIVAPNMFRFGVEETVAINVYGIQGAVDVEVFLQDNPGRGFTFSKKVVKVENEKQAITKMVVKPSDIPDVVITDQQSKVYVYLVIKCTSPKLSFKKESLVLVSPHKGYVFVQTDKPVYTPRQDVRLRIIPLDQDLTLMKSPFRVRILNAHNITVRRFDYDQGNINGIITEIYKFPVHALEGIWGVSVEHGHELSSTTYVSFEVKKYVLPTFDVKIVLPKTIMEDFDRIDGQVIARYVYDKPVLGAVRLRYGVKAGNGEVSYLPDDTKVEVKKLKGEAVFSIPMEMIRKKFNGFPEAHKFHVEATVVEGVSGKEFTRIEENSYFQKSPYIINFKKTLSNFKIGLIFSIQAQVQLVSKAPVTGISVVFTVKTDDGTKLAIVNNKRQTDQSGYVQLKISVPNTNKLTIEVVTEDNRLKKDQQGKGTFVLFPYKSANEAYLGIEPLDVGRKLQKGGQFDGKVTVNPWQHVNRVNFAVISRGKVLVTGKTATEDGKNTLERTFTFRVTEEMIPSIRVVVFTNYKGHLIADSMWMDVEDSCQHDVEMEIIPRFGITEPGERGNVVVKAAKHTIVGLVTVDKAVYILRNKGLLTADKVYEAMEGYDIGCGAGSGKDTANVLEKSGIIILTSAAINNEQRDHFKCNDLTRHKRELETHAEKYMDVFVKSCCIMAQRPSKFQATCQIRTTVLKSLLAEKYPDKLECADAFLNCCLARSAVLARTGVDEQLEFVEDLDAKESQALVRSFFPESWLFEELKMGKATEKNIPVSLPHSITTWVFQALSVSPTHGLCIAKPKEVIVQQKVFLDVNIPYSVVRNEEIEIKVTVFNYLPRTVPVTVYMYGVKGLCTGAEPGKRTDRRLIYVPKNNAISTGFFIIPLEIGRFKLRFVALSEVKSDVVEKFLNVRAEGIPQTKDSQAVLDPSNYNGRPGSAIWLQRPDGYSYFLDSKNKKLVVSMPIIPPVNSIVETESATITVIGDSFGPTVKTAFTKNELGKFINKPRGCGEQNMMLMAPTLYTMKYLAATGKLGSQEEKSGYKWIRLGYERQLNFRREDGGYSAGGNRKTSTWLTAFVMKCFCQADSFINVDEVVSCTGLQYLVNTQEKDGSFMDRYPVYHKEMTGGAKGSFTMTAFVLIALTECTKCNIKDIQGTRTRAIAFLEKGIETKKRPYELAVATYALTLAKSPKHLKAVKLLKDASIYNLDLDLRNWEKGNGALSVEATGYGLLTFVLLKDLAYAKAVVSWLNANRGFGGVWKSTQDTVVALQAMAEYSINSRQPNINLAINITSETDNKFLKTLAINNENFQDLQSIDINKPGGLVFIDAYGEGIAELNMQLRYNIPVPPNETCAFDLTVKSEEVDDFVVPRALAGLKNNALDDMAKDVLRTVGVKDQVDILEVLGESEDDDGRDRAGGGGRPSKKLLKIEVCAKLKGPLEETSMAIIDVGIFTGYRVLEEDLEDLMNKANSPIQQYEKSSRGIIFYLDSISSKKTTCLKFRAEQAFRVGSAQQASVIVYDYYKPKLTCTAFYAPGQTSTIKKSLCTGNKACICPRGGCSLCNAFDDVLKMSKNLFPMLTRELLHQTCNEHNYVWLISVVDIRLENELKLIDVEINEVIKPGVEGTAEQLRKGSRRTLITYKHCKCPELNLGNKYYIMGQDGTKWESEGVAKYRYLINPSARIFHARRIKDTAPKYKLLMKAFNWLQKRFVRYKRGCGL